ncbi:hypothetical protein VPH35_032471 [Triticum aestivum]
MASRDPLIVGRIVGDVVDYFDTAAQLRAVRQAIYAPGWRFNFVTRDLAECYGLGAPVTAAYFNCQREGSCGGRRYS